MFVDVKKKNFYQDAELDYLNNWTKILIIHMKPLKNYLTKMIQLGIPWPCDTECFSFAYAYNAIKHLNGRMLNL